MDENNEPANTTTLPLIVGIGEVLWDILPTGPRIGGAPANFVFHVNQLGVDGHLVSRVGSGPESEALVLGLSAKKIDPRYIQVDTEHPVGRVHVTLKDSQPIYQIEENAAWDYLTWDIGLSKLAPQTNAVSFGTLAQRSPQARATIRRFLYETPARCVRYFDVNLRLNYFNREIVEDGLKRASILKVNETELAEIGNLFRWGSVTDRIAAVIFANFPV